MVLIRKNKDKVYIELTREYLRSLDGMGYLNSSPYLIAESYRAVLCRLLDLETESSNYITDKYIDELVKRLEPVARKYKLASLNREQKQGVLEACIHCIEKTRKVVEQH